MEMDKWHSIGNGIKWRNMDNPVVIEYRQYKKGKKKISAALRHPNENRNKRFWEIYCLKGNLFDDLKQFDTEEEMEEYIKNRLKKEGR